MGTAIRKHYSSEEKIRIVLEFLKETKSLGQISSEYGIHHSLIVRWKKQVLDTLPLAFSKETKEQDIKMAHERKISALYQEIGQLTTQLSWLKKKSGMS